MRRFIKALSSSVLVLIQKGGMESLKDCRQINLPKNLYKLLAKLPYIGQKRVINIRTSQCDEESNE